MDHLRAGVVRPGSTALGVPAHRGLPFLPKLSGGDPINAMYHQRLQCREEAEPARKLEIYAAAVCEVHAHMAVWGEGRSNWKANEAESKPYAPHP